MTTGLLAPGLRPAIDGDYVTSPALREQYANGYVRADCGTPARKFYCLSCKCHLANPYQVELHVGATGGCTIAKLCPLPRHGAEALTLPSPPTPGTP